MPSSRATAAIGRPLLWTSSTASRLNSLVNPRRVRWDGCLCSSPMRTSSHPRCPASGGRSRGRYVWGVVARPGAEDGAVILAAYARQAGCGQRPLLRLVQGADLGWCQDALDSPMVGLLAGRPELAGWATAGRRRGSWQWGLACRRGGAGEPPSCEPAELGKDSGDVQRWWRRGTAHALCPLPQTCMIRSHDREDGSATGRHSGAVPFPNASTRRALG